MPSGRFHKILSRRYTRENGMDWFHAMDSTGIAHDYGVLDDPVMFLIGPDGRVITIDTDITGRAMHAVLAERFIRK